ncbi:MAG: RNA polymerase sigma factor [Clostridia bacterium]|nr:RNA polymerase sigma factor [Clostridia bacterium]
MDRKDLDQLMYNLQQGDESAFEKIYNETKNGLFSFILSICKNYHTAEDLMQNTYIRLRASIKSYETGANALAWIYTIAKNLTYNELNRRKREITTDFDDSTAVFGGSYEIDDKLPGPTIAIMRKVLNEQEFQIITLYLVAGFKHREIAEMLNKPIGTVLWAYRNALNKIKKELEKEGGD